MRPEITTSKRFWLIAMLYLTLSFGGLWLTTGGYISLIYIFLVLPYYLILAIALTIICFRSRQVRFSNLLLCLVAVIYVITVLLNFGDAGYYGITCETKSLFQKLLDRAQCSQPWFSYELYLPILLIHLVSLLAFVADVIRRQTRRSH
jgi:hypothetical protein